MENKNANFSEAQTQALKKVNNYLGWILGIIGAAIAVGIVWIVMM